MLPYNRNVTLQAFELFSAYARLYNAAASPASRLRSAGSLAITFIQSLKKFFFSADNTRNMHHLSFSLSLVDNYQEGKKLMVESIEGSYSEEDS